MRERRLIAREWEARNWAKLGLLLRPMKPPGLIPPCQPGDRLWGAEAWQFGEEEFCHCPQGSEPSPCDAWLNGTGCASMRGMIVYAANVSRDDTKCRPRWNQAQQMPREFARLFATCVSCTAVKLSELTEAQLSNCGHAQCDECYRSPYGRGAIEDYFSSAMGSKPWRICTGTCDGNTHKEQAFILWRKDNPRYPWETSWAWAIEVKHE